LSISPPSSPQSPPSRPEIGGGSGAHKKDKDGGEGSLEKPKSKKRKSAVQDEVKGQDHHEEALVTSKKDEKERKDKKEKKEKTDKKAKDEKKGKEGKKDTTTTAQGDLIEKDNAPALIPPSNLASTSTTTPLESQAKKGKKEKKPKSSQVNEAESSTPKTKKQKKSKPPPPIPTPGPVPSNSTPGMNGPDELSSDEADIFEIDELLPSSPVLPSPPPPPPKNESISQPTPTPKPRKKRVSDSSGFDTPSAPDHLRHPHALSNITGSGDTPSRLGRIGGTPIKKALVRLGASWVTSTPAPK